MTRSESVYACLLSIKSEVKLVQFGGKIDTKRDEITTFNDDDELERVRDPDETQTIVVALVVVVVVEIVATRFDDDHDDDDDARRTRTRETCKTTSSGENKDESEE